jgi:hypothetical protein
MRFEGGPWQTRDERDCSLCYEGLEASGRDTPGRAVLKRLHDAADRGASEDWADGGAVRAAGSDGRRLCARVARAVAGHSASCGIRTGRPAGRRTRAAVAVGWRLGLCARRCAATATRRMQ